jgi:hypothetical protein
MHCTFYPYGKNVRNPLDRQRCGLQNLAERSRELHNTFPREAKGGGGGGRDLGNKCELLFVFARILVWFNVYVMKLVSKDEKASA